jgi:hypothetical protein
MNIVLQSPTICTPFKAFWNWLTEAPPPVHNCRIGHHVSPIKVASQMPRAITLRSQVLANEPNLPARRNAQRPLRTLRVMEVGQAPEQVGRMVISGRMADVCAELDRLAACEARLH